MPKRAEVLVRIDAVAICATDLEIIEYGSPALILGGKPFNKNFTPGHEYMGTVVALGPGVDEFRSASASPSRSMPAAASASAAARACTPSCHNYGLNYGDVDKGHRANGFTTDGGFCEYQVNNINTADPDSRSDVGRGSDAGRHRRHRDVRADRTRRSGRRRERRRHRPGPDRSSRRRGGEGDGRAAGDPHRHARQSPQDRKELGADHVINVQNDKDVVAAVKRLNGGKGVDYVVECSGAPNAVTEAVRMVNRGGKVCLAAFPHDETPVDVAHIVRNNIYLYGIRGEGKSATHRAEAFMSQKRFDATKIHTHTFALDDLPTAIRYAKDRVDDAIKVVVKARGVAAHRVAAE